MDPPNLHSSGAFENNQVPNRFHRDGNNFKKRNSLNRSNGRSRRYYASRKQNSRTSNSRENRYSRKSLNCKNGNEADTRRYDERDRNNPYKYINQANLPDSAKNLLSPKASTSFINSLNSFSNNTEMIHDICSSSLLDDSTKATSASISNLSLQEQTRPGTILELVKEVCIEPDVNEENVTDKFVRALVSNLLNLTDIVPDHNEFIYKIISTLVELGMKCSESIESSSSNHRITKNKNNSIKDLQSLIDVDSQLQNLMEQRVNIYSNILKNQLVPSACTGAQAQFSDESEVENNIKSIKQNIAKNMSSFNDLKSKVHICDKKGATSTPKEKIESAENQKASYNEIISNKSTNNNKPNNKHNFNFANKYFGSVKSTEIICFCLFEDVVIAGYKNGTLLIYSIDSGSLIDNVQPHKKAVTTLSVWQNIIITTSLDGTMKLYDMKNKTTKKLIVGQEIFTSFHFKDTLYLGTKSGYIFRLSLKNMKQISNPFCVSKEAVMSIQVVELKHIDVMFIACSDASVCIRHTHTGSLLQVFHQLKNISSMVVLNDSIPQRICAGFDNKLLAIGLDNSISAGIIKVHSVSCLHNHKGVLFAASKNKNIYVYDEISINLLSTIVDGEESVISMTVKGNYLLIAMATEGFKYVDIPNVVLDYWRNKECTQ